jgi:hypothetical protein
VKRYEHITIRAGEVPDDRRNSQHLVVMLNVVAHPRNSDSGTFVHDVVVNLQTEGGHGAGLYQRESLDARGRSAGADRTELMPLRVVVGR